MGIVLVIPFPPFYDSLVSKVIVKGASRADALSNAFQYLKSYSIVGLPTTVPFHAWILANSDFQTNGIDIGYVERTFTADGARDALALLATDTTHRESQNGAPFTEKVEVLGKGGERVFVEIVHESGGTFVAIPLVQGASRSEQNQWCRSNTRATALAAVEGRLRR